MFFHWWEPYGYMNLEVGQQESQTEALSQKLFGLTFWGDYGGDIISRYHYTMLLEAYPNVVRSIEAMHGQGLVLSNYLELAGEGELSEVIRFVGYMDPSADSYNGYPLYNEDGYCDWESALSQEEMVSGWWAEYYRGELVDYMGDWDNTLVPDAGTPEWGTLVYEFQSKDDFEHIETYWEGADSLVVRGWETEEVAEWLLGRYADEITNAGNPEPLEF